MRLHGVTAEASAPRLEMMCVTTVTVPTACTARLEHHLQAGGRRRQGVQCLPVLGSGGPGAEPSQWVASVTLPLLLGFAVFPASSLLNKPSAGIGGSGISDGWACTGKGWGRAPVPDHELRAGGECLEANMIQTGCRSGPSDLLRSWPVWRAVYMQAISSWSYLAYLQLPVTTGNQGIMNSDSFPARYLILL